MKLYKITKKNYLFFKSKHRKIISENFRSRRGIFKSFLLLNIITSFIFGLICMILDPSLCERSSMAFFVVLIFMMLDFLTLLFSLLLILTLSCCLSFLRRIKYKPTILGCLPLIYKLGLYILYIALFPFCIMIFVKENDENIEEITYLFLIYQMIIAGVFLLNGCYEIVKNETTSDYLLEIESQKSLYQIDDNEIELLHREIEKSREPFKGSL